MKIIFISDTIYPYFKGGKEKRIYEITKRLAEKGQDIHIFTMKWWKGSNSFKKDNITYHAICKLLPIYTSKRRRSIKEALYFSYKIFFALFLKKFDALEADQVPYFQLFPIKIITLFKKKKLVVPWLEVWGKKYWKEYLGWKGYFGYAVERLSIYLPDKFIAISQLTKEKLVQFYHVPEKKISTIAPYGIDIDKFKNFSKKNSFDCIYCGRLLNHKNVDKLISAIKILKIKYPKVSCLIIGEGPEKQKLIEITSILNLQDNIKFLDFIENEHELFSYLASAKVFVLPSTREGFGISVIEANACGKQAIVIEHPDNASKDLIKNAHNGFISPSLKEEELAEKIEQALLQSSSKSIKQNCLNNALKYQWPSIIKQTLNCYLTSQK